MGIVWVRERRNRSGSDNGADLESDREFQVRVDSSADDDQYIKFTIPGQMWPRVAGGTPSVLVPNYLWGHPTNAWALCKKIKVDHVEGLIWSAKFTYDNKPLTERQEKKIAEPNPLQRPVAISWSMTEYPIPVIRDYQDNAFLTSSMEYFDPPVELSWDHITFHFRKAYPGYSPPAWPFDLRNSVNNGAIYVNLYPARSIPAGQGRLKNLRMSDVQYEGIDPDNPNIKLAYFWLDYDLELKKEGHQPQAVDQGLYRLVAGKKVRIKYVDVDPDDGSDDPVDSPQLLNSGSVIVNPTIDNAQFRTCERLTPASYAGIPGLGGVL